MKKILAAIFKTVIGFGVWQAFSYVPHAILIVASKVAGINLIPKIGEISRMEAIIALIVFVIIFYKIGDYLYPSALKLLISLGGGIKKFAKENPFWVIMPAIPLVIFGVPALLQYLFK